MDHMDMLKGGLLGLTTDTLGAPVDLATMAMRPMGYNVQKPVMVSYWLADKLSSQPKTGSGQAARVVGGLLSPDPMDAVKLAGLLGMVKKPIWYHGSPYDIYGKGDGWFKLSKGESDVPVVWGTDDMLTAEGYARGESSFIPDIHGKMPLTKSWYKDYDGSGGVYSLNSTAKNNFEFDAEGKDWFMIVSGSDRRLV